MIINGTSHTIHIYQLSDTTPIQDGRKLILKEGAQPVAVIPAGTNLNAVKANADIPDALKSSFPFLVKGAVEFISHDPIPGNTEIVVVSNLYRSAVKELGGDTSRLATVDGTVYDSEEAIRPCGCLGLAIG